jgi:tetrahydromethanopterin S-methyltransferase subunit A
VPPGEATDTGDRGPVAVCTLADRKLAAELAGAPGVSLSGPLMTANLGITALIRAVLDRPWIQVLLVCGADSPLFGAGDSLIALDRNGVSEPDLRIIGTRGYVPVLSGLTWQEVEAFRHQVQVVDLRGERDPDRLRAHSAKLAGHADGQTTPATNGAALPPRGRSPEFITLRPCGHREPVATAGEGFFVIGIDRASHRVTVEHYWPDYRLGHRMSGVRAESMLLGLIDAGIISCLSHAGYLGMELAKAETALRLGLDYDQDKPLRSAARSPTGKRG